MNSKNIILIISSLLYGCGVRGRPLEAPETAIQSYIESHTGTANAKEDKTSTPPAPEKNK